MHPARSVIAFTTLSGAGYGLLFWLGLSWLGGALAPREPVALWTLAVGATLVTAGLISSTLHLGRPERAWRALSQWRSSWLSREGVAAVATYVPIALAAATAVAPPDGALAGAQPWLGAALALGSAATVFCTGMIYASLKAIARWHSPLVTPVYLLFAAMSGAMLLLLLSLSLADTRPWLAGLCIAVTAVAWTLKWLYWRTTDAVAVNGGINSATGLGGDVRPFDPPHTEDNYLLKEMGFRIARKHARKLRRSAAVLGLVVPLVALAAGALANAPWQLVTTVLAAAALMLGVTLERWLFFAEARHTVGLYYGL